MDVRGGLGSAGPCATTRSSGMKTSGCGTMEVTGLDETSVGGLVKTKPVWNRFEGIGGEEIEILEEHAFWS